MGIEIIGPAVSSEAVADLSRHLRLPVGFDDDADRRAQLERLLSAATQVVEERTRRLLLARTATLCKSAWDDGDTLVLPVGPVISVDGLAVVAEDGGRGDVPVDAWRLETLRGRPHLRARAGRRLPAIPAEGHVEARYRAGYGEVWSDAPQDLRQAAVILGASWFDAGGAPGGAVPATVNALIAPYLPVRL
ncbi:head-tail connector protein [Rubrimonas cliftonensis]|uniref:Phage gp6-like head-tail connector protein n=1 Tax=Rubrimonas cliftonensis TaxID=89524 RepID=A0A1H3ZIT1_9RHOB|nr:hypothetical protein [Rubrimonas cliftonensis]SEA23154.1 phage conserved hypothetical protein, phiE125 gp8 family [Rubrimonas cliftonensis]